MVSLSVTAGPTEKLFCFGVRHTEAGGKVFEMLDAPASNPLEGAHCLDLSQWEADHEPGELMCSQCKQHRRDFEQGKNDLASELKALAGATRITFTRTEASGLPEDAQTALKTLAGRLGDGSRKGLRLELTVHTHAFCDPQHVGDCDMVELSKKRGQTVARTLAALLSADDEDAEPLVGLRIHAWGCRHPTEGPCKAVTFCLDCSEESRRPVVADFQSLSSAASWSSSRPFDERHPANQQLQIERKPHHRGSELAARGCAGAGGIASGAE